MSPASSPPPSSPLPPSSPASSSLPPSSEAPASDFEPLAPPLLEPLGRLPLLLPELLPLEELLDAVAPAQVPLTQASEQHSPKLVHEAPELWHVAVAPPHTPFWQSLSQQSDDDEQLLPSALQLGVTHTPLEQLPLQQSLPDVHDSPAVLQVLGDAAGATQTPEQAVLQQSCHDEQTVPAAAQLPDPPSSSVKSGLGAVAQPWMTRTAARPAPRWRMAFMLRSHRNGRAQITSATIARGSVDLRAVATAKRRVEGGRRNAQGQLPIQKVRLHFSSTASRHFSRPLMGGTRGVYHSGGGAWEPSNQLADPTSKSISGTSETDSSMGVSSDPSSAARVWRSGL